MTKTTPPAETQKKPVIPATVKGKVHLLKLLLQTERIAIRQGFVPEHCLDQEVELIEKLEKQVGWP